MGFASNWYPHGNRDDLLSYGRRIKGGNRGGKEVTGVYTQITEIIAPTKAVAGSRVDITVKIKNLLASTIGIMVDGALEYSVIPWPGIMFPTDWANVPGGATQSFAGYFTMPNSDVRIHAYSYWYSAETYSWYFDDEATKDIKLEVLKPVFSDFKVKDYIKV